MGLFDKSRSEAVSHSVRETLFGDVPLDAWPPAGAAADAFPWNKFVQARSHVAAGNKAAAIDCWKEILTAPNLEPRHYLQAWHFLTRHGCPAPAEIAKQVLGVVVEVGLPQGVDLLAAYPDHSARYYNFSGAAVVWEHPDGTLDQMIDELMAASVDVVARIGPWDKQRPAPPPIGDARLSFLTPGGLHFGQGSMMSLWQDPPGRRVLQSASSLMQALISKTKAG